MGTHWSYSAADRQEYLDWGPAFDDVPCAPKYPVERPQAEVLYRLLQGPWNGSVIHCHPDTGDRPWKEWVDGHEGWRSVEDVHRDLVTEAIADAMDVLQERTI